MSSIAPGSLSSSYLQQLLASALQSAGVTQNTSKTSGASTSPLSLSDSAQLSPFARLAATLQQLQQSDPTKYAQVAAQVATNLQAAAKTATSQGNPGAASQLNQLASDFSTASQTGQLPNLQDLSQAIGGSGGGHHHHHHAHGGSSSDSSTSDLSGSSTQSLLQSVTSLQSTDSQSTQTSQKASTDPGAIIFQTLSNAGISLSGN